LFFTICEVKWLIKPFDNWKEDLTFIRSIYPYSLLSYLIPYLPNLLLLKVILAFKGILCQRVSKTLSTLLDHLRSKNVRL
jgi:hypothetical protein